MQSGLSRYRSVAVGGRSDEGCVVRAGKILALAVAFGLGFGSVAFGQSGAGRAPSSPIANGIWFQVKAAFKPVARPTSGGKDTPEPNARLSMKLRISAHSDGSNFYGHPVQSFDFKLSEGSGEKLYWQDSACHQRRGLPKVSVVDIDGKLEKSGQAIDIKAFPRHIGVKLPDDEILPGSGFIRALVAGRQVMTFEAHTKNSGLIATVRIYGMDCRIEAVAR